MNAGQRIAILVVAGVILVGGFVLAQGASDDEPTAAAPVTTAAEPEPGATTPGAAATAPAEPRKAPPAPRVETIRMKGRAPVGEPKTITFQSGDTVRLRFRSDVAEEVHIHGYDKYVDVPAGGTARASFEADAEGVFEVESHGSGELLAKLAIEP